MEKKSIDSIDKQFGQTNGGTITGADYNNNNKQEEPLVLTL